MNENDARFLIDQFNKYASWMVNQPIQIFLSSFAVALAAVAFLLSLLRLSDFPEWVTFWGYVVFTILFIWLMYYGTYRPSQEHRMNEERLHLLMDHFLEHHSLPGEVTFDLLAKKRVNELKEMLKHACTVEGNPRDV